MALIPKTVRGTKRQWAAIKKNAKAYKMSEGAYLVALGSGEMFAYTKVEKS